MATATPTGPACGNGIQEAGEFCDDGNTQNCDSCPANCQAPPGDCTATATRHPQSVAIQAPAGTGIGGVQICLTYPVGTVGLPGTGSVTSRVTGFSGSSSVNDFNNAAQLSLLPNGGPEQFSFTLSFDLCSGASAPPPTAFHCVTKQASDQFSNPIEPPTLVECTPQ